MTKGQAPLSQYAPVSIPASPSTTHRIDWPVLLFAIGSPLVAVAGSVWWFASGHFHAGTIVLGCVMAIATGLGITGAYHRLYSHRSFETVWPVRLLLLLMGGAAMEESALKWSYDHRRHHRNVDQSDDPYGIQRGFWYAHFLWMFHKREMCAEHAWPADLWKDPLVRFQHRYYLWTAIPVSFLLPMAIASLWGDAWGGLFVAGWARVVINHHLTFMINSVCHSIGSQPYSDRHSARDNWLTAFFTYGEGFHNFHHEFSADYRNGHRAHHYDPTKWMIAGLEKLRLASNLRRSRWEVIASKRIAMQEKRLVARLRAASAANHDAVMPRLIAARGRVEATFAALQRLRHHQRQDQRSVARGAATNAPQRQHSRQGEHATWREREAQLHAAHAEFRHAVASWDAAVASL
jgi:stearoyl-CoA desaturase (delta-9 desaturase)